MDVLDADRDFPWDEHVGSSPYGCFFHLSGWIQALENLTKGKLYRLVFRKRDQVVALCPIFALRRGPLRAAYSPPFAGASHHMGPVVLGYDGLTQRRRGQLMTGIQRALDGFLADELGCNYVEFRCPPGFLDGRSLQWAGYRVSLLYTRILDLALSADDLWNRFSPDLRRNVRKCEGQVVSREAFPDEIPDFLRVVRQRYHDVEVEYPLTGSFLQEAFEVLGPEFIRLFVAEESGTIQTGLILVMHAGRATVWHGSSRPRASRLPVSEHLHWFVTSWAHEQGFRELEIMGADNPRLEEFKSKFNARLVPCLHAEKARSWYRTAERIGRIPPSLF